MATRWFVNTGSDWGLDSRWSTTEGGAGGASFPVTGDNAWFSDTSADATCTLAANRACTNLSTRTTETGGTNNYSNVLDFSTYKLTVSNSFNLAGRDSSNKAVLTIGAAGELDAVNIYLRTNSTVNLASDSILRARGAITADNVAIWSATGGTVICDGGGSVSVAIQNSSNKFSSFEITTGTTATITSTTVGTQGSTGTYSTLNGTLVSSAYFNMNHSNAATITIGSAFSFQGSAILRFNLGGMGLNITNDCVSDHSFSGTYEVFGFSSPYPCINLRVPNAEIKLRAILDGDEVRIRAGTLKASRIYVDTLGDNDSITINNSVYNPNIELGSLDTNESGGTYTVTWTKGTGTITFVGTTGIQTNYIDELSGTLEAIIFNCSGATKVFNKGFSSDGITMTAGTVQLKEGQTTTITNFAGTGGTLQSGVSGTQATITLTNAGTCSGVTFKDIAMNAANKINAKNSCINNGNCLGVVFQDAIGYI